MNRTKQSRNEQSHCHTKNNEQFLSAFHQWYAFHITFVRFYGPVNPLGSCRVRSVFLTPPVLGMLSPLSGKKVFVRILSPETDKSPSWTSGRERMPVENISWSISRKECGRPRRKIESATSCSPVERASNWATNIIDRSVVCFCLFEFCSFWHFRTGT